MRGDSSIGTRRSRWRTAALGSAAVLQALALVAHLTSHTADATSDATDGQERFAAAAHPAQAAHLDAPAEQRPPNDSKCLCGQHGTATERAPEATGDLPARVRHADVLRSCLSSSRTPSGPARAPPAA